MKGSYYMEKTINGIYEMLYENILTPYNLLENSKLDNYTYVKYYKRGSTLITEMECTCEDNLKRRFYYEFDSNDCLLKVTSINAKKQVEVLFDRSIELANLIEEYHAKIETRLSKEAI